MHPVSRRLRTFVAAGAAVAATASLAAAQGTGDFHYEKQLAAGSLVRLNNVDGDISVVPSTSGKVEITGRRTRTGDRPAHVEVHETSNGLIACVMWDDVDGSCDEDGYHIHDDNGSWRRRGSMDLEVRVPANLRVSAGSVSGDVRVDGAHGDLRASSVSGNVSLHHLTAGALRATSVSGDVDAQIDAFDGDGDITAKSVSGDVTLEMPKALDADVSVSTVSGQVDSDYPMTLNGRMSRRRIEARIGKGGRDLDISTVSGDVALRAAK